MRVANDFKEGKVPTYGRIMGLAKKLDQGVKNRMYHPDFNKSQTDAVQQLMTQGRADTLRKQGR